MDIKPTKPYRILQAVAGLVFLLVLFVVSRYNYLLFHGLVELFAIAVAWSVFLLVWNTRRISSNDALLFLGIAYFFVGFIDLVHTLAYKGMGVFADSLAPNHPTQLWIAARGVEAAALLLFPLLLGRRIRPWPVLLGCAGVTGLLLAAILAWGIFPACYIEGAGLTGFKVGAEYMICAMLALAIGLLFKQREFLDGAVWRLMIGAMAVTIAGELAFTLYTDIYGLSNVLGHLLKVVSFFLVYQALVPATVARPLTTVFRGVEQEKQILDREGSHLRLLHKTASLFLKSETLDDTIGTLPGLIADHYAVPIVAIELYDADRQEMGFAGAVGIPKAEDGRLRVPVDQTLSGTVATSGRAVIDSDVSEHADYRAEALRELGVKTFVCVPLTGQAGVIGTLAIADSEERTDILDGADLLQALADSLAQEISRRQDQDALNESERTLRQSLDGQALNIALLDDQGGINFVNRAWLEFAEGNDGNAESVSNGVNYLEVCDEAATGGDDVARMFADGLRRVISGAVPFFELEYPCHSPLEERWFIGAASRITGDGLMRVVVSHQDITARRQVEEHLRESEAKYRHLYETMTQGVVLQDAEGKIVEANRAAGGILGLTRDQLFGRTAYDPRWKLIREDGSPYDPSEMPSNLALRTGKPVKNITCGIYVPEKDEYRWIVIGSAPQFRGSETEPSLTMTVFTDITEKKQVEDERALLLEMLEILNARTGLRETMQSLLKFMQEMSGCEAVGIRLRDGADFPYYVTSGFSGDFVKAERHLCVQDLDGQLLRDEMGNPVLECMCGNIICGRFDSALPFFTEFGSFVSNGTSELLATTAEADRQARTRNRCNAEGYESVLLVPLRTGDETFGLLQFNDRRENRFSDGFVARIERLAGDVAMVLAQRRTEEELHKSEERRRLAVQSARIGLWEADLVRDRVWWDEGYDQLFGSRPVETGESWDWWIERIHPEDRDRVRESLDSAIKGGDATWSCAYRFRLADGSYGDLQGWASIEKGPAGDPVRVMGSMLDVTDLLQARRAEAESEERHRAILSTVMDGFWITDTAGRFLEVNETYCEMSGYSADELLGMDISAVEDIETAAETAAHVQKVMAEGQDLFESRHRRKDGSVFDVEVSVQYRTTDEPTCVVFIRDITERKRAETVLRESEERFRTIIDAIGAIGEGLFIVDVDYRVRYMNQVMIDGFGDQTGKICYQSVGGLEGECEYCRLKQVIDEGETVHYQPTTADGRTFDIIAVPIKNNDGTISKMEVIRDITERKRAEEALQSSEERLELAVTGTGVGLWDWNMADDVVHFSPQWKRMLGYEEHEIENTIAGWKRLWHPDDADKIERAVDNHMAGRTSVYEIEHRLRHKNGSWRWILTRGDIVKDSEGKPVRWVGTNLDITERKAIEEALEKRIIALTQPLDSAEEVTFDALFNLKNIQLLQDQFASATGVASIITNTDGVPITRPSNFCRLCNDIIRKTDKGLANCFKSDAVLGKVNPDGPTIQPCLSGGLWDAGAGISVGGRHIANWLIGQVRDETQTDEKMRAHAREIGANEEAVVAAFHEVPAMSREKFGEVAQALFTLANQLSDAAYRNVQQARFIFEKKHAEEDLRQGRERLAGIIRGTNVGTWEWNVQTGETIFNERWAEIIGYTLDELSPCSIETWRKFAHPDDLKTSDGLLQKHFAGELDYYVFEARMRHKSGEWVWVLDQGRVTRWTDDGQPLMMMGTHQDITERKQAEVEKEKLESQLRQAQKMEAVGRLAGGVAHDFNNMLGVILGHAEMTLEDMTPDQPFYTDLEEIKAAAQRSADLTRQLLAFARKQTVAPKVLDINKTVGSMTRMLRRLIGEDIDMAWLPGEHVWQVCIDPAQIDQILANLCVNARDAIAGVGKVTIETDNVSLDEAYCADHAGFVPGEYVMLAVSDNGCGMDAGFLDNIFEPFFTTKEQDTGTGLGLSTVYGVVKQNNGFIIVYSEPGQGTTFKIYLPRHTAKAVETEKRQPRAAARGRETILLVEDEPAILHMTTTMLERQGYTVVGAGTPGEAIRLAREHTGKIDLLMTDVVMPEMNGRDLAKNILSLYPGIRSLFMSGYTANVIAHHGVLDEGVNFIQKPFSKGDLAAKVREVLERE